MKYLFTFAVLFSCTPFFVLANGFVPDSIWLSNDAPKDGEVVDIFVTVFNTSAATISGTIRYYDDEVLLGEVPVTIPQKGAKLVSLTWEADQGDRVIFARFSSGDAPLEETRKIQLRVKAPIIPVTTTNTKKDSTKDAFGDDIDSSSSQEEEVAGEFSAFVDKAIVFTKDTAITVFDHTESARSSGGEYLAESKDSIETKKEILIEKGVEESSSPFMFDVKKFAIGAYVFLLGVLVFIVTTKILFYLSVLIIILGIIHLIRRRRDAYYD